MIRRSALWTLGLVLAACPKDPGDTSTGETTGGPPGTTTGVSPTTTGASTTGSTTATASSGDATTGADPASTGSSGEVDPGTTTGATTSTTTTTSTSTSTTGTTAGSSTGVDETTTGDASTGEAPDLFDCDGCTCDANISYCQKVLAGVQPIFEQPAAACPIVKEEDFISGCVLYPPECADAPTCDCLATMICFDCQDLGAGHYKLTCPLP